MYKDMGTWTAGAWGGEKFAGIPVFWKRLLLSPAHPLKNHLL